MKTRLFALLFILGYASTYGQVKLADKFFNNYGYVKAIQLYEKAVENGGETRFCFSKV